MKESFVHQIQKRLTENSKLFLSDGIERLLNQDNGNEDYINPDLLSLTCTSFQISIELALKSLALERAGLKSILNKKYENHSLDELEDLFKNNNIKTSEFESVKNFVKSKGYITDLARGDFKVIEQFQIYRNRIVHFTYEFEEIDLYDMKYDLIYYLIQIIFKILLSNQHQDVKPSEFLAYSLKNGLHSQLTHYPPYIEAMERVSKENTDSVFKCIVCNNRTFSKFEEYCYCCNFITEDFKTIDCVHCKETKSVIYDNLNIELNKNSARGLCLNCDTDGMIYQCPVCEFAYDNEIEFEKYCTEGNCVNN